MTSNIILIFDSSYLLSLFKQVFKISHSALKAVILVYCSLFKTFVTIQTDEFGTPYPVVFEFRIKFTAIFTALNRVINADFELNGFTNQATFHVSGFNSHSNLYAFIKSTFSAFKQMYSRYTFPNKIIRACQRSRLKYVRDKKLATFNTRGWAKTIRLSCLSLTDSTTNERLFWERNFFRAY